MTNNYKAWFEKYRPRELKDLVLPNEEIGQTLNLFYDQEFIRGNILSYGPPGLGKTSLTEILIHKIIKDRNVFVMVFSIYISIFIFIDKQKCPSPIITSTTCLSFC